MKPRETVRPTTKQSAPEKTDDLTVSPHQAAVNEIKPAPVTAGQTTEQFAAAIGWHPESVRRAIRQNRIHALPYLHTEALSTTKAED